VTYERYQAGRTLHVAAPHDAATSDVMESRFALKTKALEQRFVTTLTHCAHYYFNRTCNLGSECRFVHAVFIDPQARPGQRAPPPSAMGRTSAIPSSAATNMTAADDATRYSTPAMPSLGDVSSGARTPPSTPVTTVLMSALSTPRSCESCCGVNSELMRSGGVDDLVGFSLQRGSPCSDEGLSCTHRFRHDPYSPHMSRVAV